MAAAAISALQRPGATSLAELASCAEAFQQSEQSELRATKSCPALQQLHAAGLAPAVHAFLARLLAAAEAQAQGQELQQALVSLQRSLLRLLQPPCALYDAEEIYGVQPTDAATHAQRGAAHRHAAAAQDVAADLLVSGSVALLTRLTFCAPAAPVATSTGAEAVGLWCELCVQVLDALGGEAGGPAAVAHVPPHVADKLHAYVHGGGTGGGQLEEAQQQQAQQQAQQQEGPGAAAAAWGPANVHSLLECVRASRAGQQAQGAGAEPPQPLQQHEDRHELATAALLKAVHGALGPRGVERMEAAVQGSGGGAVWLRLCLRVHECLRLQHAAR